ncbi:MAG: pilus assembly protein TadE [Gracilibacter sp. BRH_c7a]|nr:MAG: pilus assembly protein TadE [Gracilibacter sp. BRH_c7a]
MIKKKWRSSSGQALVEFALVLPLFLLLIFAVVEISHVGYSYVTLNNAVRSGARVASLGGLDTNIRNTVSTSSPLFDTNLLNVTITPNETNRRSGTQVTVTASYEVHLTTPVLSQVLPNPVNIESSLSMRIE